MSDGPIDREALVRRHAVTIDSPDPELVLTVGNGDFAYTADITGMQTFTAFHDQSLAVREGRTAINTATMSTWGWHEMPNPEGYVLDDSMSQHQTRRGPVSYPDRHDMEGAMRGQLSEENRAGAWLNANPQRLDLGRIGFAFRDDTGTTVELTPGDLDRTRQTLDPWTGTMRSVFSWAGSEVEVTTVADPSSSTVAFRVRSGLLSSGRLAVAIRFPYAHAGFFQTSDWSSPERHRSVISVPGANRATIHRALDATRYSVHLAFTGGSVRGTGAPHHFELTAATGEVELVASFVDRGDGGEPASFDQVIARSEEHWRAFWMSGAAIDFTGSTDPRAMELERRVVLSQYQTAVNSAGVMPPQETGLVTNSWSGKFHLEMHFWHGAHFATWGRPDLLRRSLDWYRTILPQARATAERQGYPGARWPKQTGPDGRESPDPIGSFLIWQQPHILYLLELVWRASTSGDRATLLTDFAEVVEATAAFIAGFAEERDGEYHLLPPVMPAQEFYDVTSTEDPTFELAYWWWGLEIAQRWRERAGAARDEAWAGIQGGLARPHVEGGHYTAIATEPYLRRDDHPALLAAYGMVPPTPVIDPHVMNATLADVVGDWDWPSAWGWDFPVMAMTAIRLRQPEVALDALLRNEVKNRYTAVGHNPQIHSILPLYLPGNGALLAVVSLLATADGGLPSFPADWVVAAEGFVPWP